MVLYSGTDVMWATRAWWILRYAGHESASLLDLRVRVLLALGRKGQARAAGEARIGAASTWQTVEAARAVATAAVPEAEGRPRLC